MQIFRRPSYPARQTVRKATATTEREIHVSMVEKGDTVLTKTAFRMLHLPQLYGKVKTAVEKNITWQVRTRVGNKVKENSVTEPNLGFLVVRLKSTADALKTRNTLLPGVVQQQRGASGRWLCSKYWKAFDTWRGNRQSKKTLRSLI